MDVEAKPYPAFIRDNPVMAAAFSSFMRWAWEQDAMHDAHSEATGLPRPAPVRSGLDAMIDDATGYTNRYAESFAAWAIDTQWGVEGRDDQDDGT